MKQNNTTNQTLFLYFKSFGNIYYDEGIFYFTLYRILIFVETLLYNHYIHDTNSEDKAYFALAQ